MDTWRSHKATFGIIFAALSLVSLTLAGAVAFASSNSVQGLNFKQDRVAWNATGADRDRCQVADSASGKTWLCTGKVKVVRVEGSMTIKCASCWRRVEIRTSADDYLIVSRVLHVERGQLHFSLPVRYEQVEIEGGSMRAHLRIGRPVGGELRQLTPELFFSYVAPGRVKATTV
jgi:hypothetical protein